MPRRPDRLSALDAAFLDLDTPAAPLHVGWTLRFHGAPPTLEALRRHVASRIHLVPRFRRRVVEPPLGLGDPHWVDDPEFAVADHVNQIRVQPDEDLHDIAGTLLSQALPRTAPLWRLYLVLGVPEDGFAIVGQAHHALVDGTAAVEVAQLLFDIDGLPSTSEHVPVRAWAAERGPSVLEVAASSSLHRARAAVRGTRDMAMGVARRDVASLGHLWQAIDHLVTRAPSTALDASVGAQRSVAYAQADLSAVKEAGRRTGATINDMVLTASTIAIGGALRRRAEQPSLVKVLVPVSVRAADDRAVGNRISFMTVDLPVRRTDPQGILREVVRQTQERKTTGAAAPLHALARAGELLPSPLRRVLARSAVGVTSFNAVISNIVGPPLGLSVLGRPLLAAYPAVPMLHGHALSIGVLSYGGRLHAGIYGDAALVPDATTIADDLEQAFEDLCTPRNRFRVVQPADEAVLEVEGVSD